jgi:hypothetical protein
LTGHLQREWVTVVNLGGLLLGFALLSVHFEQSRIPKVLPRFLPAGWKGPLVMLAMVFVMSSFLDNIAAASWCDTTATMMWIDGVAPSAVFHAYAAAVTALGISGVAAAIQQQKHAPMTRVNRDAVAVDWVRVIIVVFILATALVVNVTVNVRFPELSDSLPFLAMGVWTAILLASFVRPPDWHTFRAPVKGTIFLLALVLSASMMPVEKLPAPSWETTFGLGFVSAAFDNIP